MKKKILINFSTSFSGGAKSYLNNLLPFLQLNDAESDVYEIIILLNESQLSLKNINQEIRYITIQNHKNIFFRYVHTFYFLKSLIKEEQIDVVFTPYQIAPIYKSVHNVLMLRNMEPFYFQNDSYSLKNKIRNIILKRLSIFCLKKADSIIAVSKFTELFLLQNLKIDRKIIELIYHGSDVLKENYLIPSLLLDKKIYKNKYIISSGSMLPYRRYEDLLYAFDSVYDFIEKGTILLIVASESDKLYTNKLYKIISSLKNKNNILFLQNIPWLDLQIYFKYAKIIVLTSEVEACPNIAIESMNSNTTVIAADIMPYKELLENYALYYNSRDVSMLSHLIKEVFNKGSKRNIHAESDYVRSKFSWLDTAIKTKKFIISK